MQIRGHLGDVCYTAIDNKNRLPARGRKVAHWVGQVSRAALAGSGDAQNLGIFRSREEKTLCRPGRVPVEGHGVVSHGAKQGGGAGVARTMSHWGEEPTALNPADVNLSLLFRGGSTCVHVPAKRWSFL